MEEKSFITLTPGVKVIKLFSLSPTLQTNKLMHFVPGRPLKSRAMFAVKTREMLPLGVEHLWPQSQMLDLAVKVCKGQTL